MTIQEAKKLKKGDKVISKIGNNICEVVSTYEYNPWCGGSPIIYFNCKVGNGDMKFSHKEVVKYGKDKER